MTSAIVHGMKDAARISPLAGKPSPSYLLVDPARLEREYYERKPDFADPNQLVSFGTSGHRGSPLHGTFNAAAHRGDHPGNLRLPAQPGHRRAAVLGKDTHAVSAPAQRTRAGGAGGERRGSDHSTDDGFTPTPVISRAILAHNRGRRPPRRRDRDHAVAQSARGRRLQVQPAQRRAGRHRRDRLDSEPGEPAAARRQRGREADAVQQRLKAATTHQEDFVRHYVRDLKNVIDMDAMRAAGLKLGVDPLGGAASGYWDPINAITDWTSTVVNPRSRPDGFRS